MKVAFVTHYSNLYGANRSLLCLIDGLTKYGVKPYVLAPHEGPITKELSHRGIPFCTIPFKRWMSQNWWKAPGRLGVNLAMLPFLVRRVGQWNVDLIHTNSSVTPVGALLAEILLLPHTWHVREFGDRDFGLSYDWGAELSHALMSRADATVAVSKAVRRHVLSDVSAPCHVVYNGVISHEHLEQLGEEGGGGNNVSSPYTFAIVGRISPEKGQKQALRALHRLKQEGVEARLLIAGDGASEYVQALRRLCESLNLGREVSFLGYVFNPFDVYQQANVVLMCSPHEAMGRVTAEAMAAARPVIGYNSDGTAELIEHGRNGLLYDGSDADLTSCMQRLTKDPEQARVLGNNGRKEAQKNYTNEVYARHIFKILKDAV